MVDGGSTRMRERVTHELTIRYLTVHERHELTPSIVRMTFTGELEEFAAPGPTDHVKVFFPDPATGILTAPTVGPRGVERPIDGIVLSRDFTPRAYRAATDEHPAELDIDFVLHSASTGPASDWASNAQIGEHIAIGGPRSSTLAPDDCTHAILIADETALAAFSRWLELLPKRVRITAILIVNDEDAEKYITTAQAQRASIEWLYRMDGPGQLDESVRSLNTFEDGTYVWAAGEAGELVPIRRHLRRERGLNREQLNVEGYWRRGITNFDHHSPIDPADPD